MIFKIKKSNLNLIIFIFFLIISGMMAQYRGPNPNSGRGIPFFQFQTFRVYHEYSSYIVAVSEILYDDLSFAKENNEYHAQYELTVYVQDEETERTLGYITRRYKVLLNEFEKTNSRTMKDSRSFQFELKPGSYKLIAIVSDMNTEKRVRRNLDLVVDNIRETGIIVSDIIFYSTNEKTGERKITVNTNFKREDKNIWAHVAVSSVNEEEPIHLQFKYAESAGNTFGFEVDTTISAHGLLDFWYLIDLSTRKKSKNLLQVIASQGIHQYQNEKNFTFFWTKSPQTSQDITVALEQMIYVAPDDSVEYYLEMPMTYQIEYFERFWDNMDPTPNTERNELKEEYYNRISFSIRAFGFFSVPGYKSDRGRIYTKFGAPEEIDRHPFEDDGVPYETWYYHALKKTFLFIDTNSMGEYRLDPRYFVYEYN